MRTTTNLASVFVSFLILGTMIFSGCSKDMDVEPNAEQKKNQKVSTPAISFLNYNGTSNAIPCGVETEVNLIAGQNYVAGTVSILNTADKLYVTYETTGGWEIGVTHLYVGALSGLPVTGSGNPKNGKFPFSSNHSPRVTSTTFEFDLNDFPGDSDGCFIVAAHAEVFKMSGGVMVQSETGWADGTDINANSGWATYASYCKEECTPDPCVYESKAYAYKDANGITVGTLTIINNATDVTFSVDLKNGWTLSQSNWLVDNETAVMYNSDISTYPKMVTHSGNVIHYEFDLALSSLPTCYGIGSFVNVSRVVNGVTETNSAWSTGSNFMVGTGTYSDFCTYSCN